MRSRLVTALVAAAVIVVACGTTTTDGRGAFQGSLVSAGSVDQKQLTRLTARFSALDQDQQKTQVADLDRSVERQLWTVAGLDRAAGGSAQADRIFAALNTALATKVATVVATPTTLRPAAKLAGPGEALGAGLFGGMLTAGATASGAVRATDNGRTGTLRSTLGVTITATRRGLRAGFGVAYLYRGVELKLDTVSVVQPCPDADGRIQLEATVAVAAKAKSSGIGGAASLDVNVTGRVGDDATLAASSYGYRLTSSRLRGSVGDLLDAGQQPGGQVIVNRVGDKVPDKFASDAVSLATMAAIVLQRQLVAAARSGWESGRCIDLRTALSSGPTKLKPGAVVTIAAKPVSTVDGRAVRGGAAAAKLRRGAGAVQSTGDGQFTYRASSVRGQTGVVALSVRSRRGVGFASVEFDTNSTPGFRAVGSAGEFHGSGTICDLSKPFTISGDGLTMGFTPSGPRRGSYTLSGSVHNEPWTGSGSYTVSLDAGETSGTMAVRGTYTVHSVLLTYGARTDMTLQLTATEC